MRFHSVYSSMILLYVLFMVTNHFRIGTALKCHGKCWENADGRATMYIKGLIKDAPRCDLSKPPNLDCSAEGYTGCMKELHKATGPEATEYTIYDCDQGESPVGCSDYSVNRDTYKSTVKHYKCTSDLCNTPGAKSCESSSGPGNSNSTGSGKDSGASCARPVEVFWMAVSMSWTVLASYPLSLA